MSNINAQMVKELRDSNILSVEHINSEINPAGLLTKPLHAVRFSALVDLSNPIAVAA